MAGDLRLAFAAGDGVAHEAIVAAGEEHSAQDGPERRGHDRRADRLRDRLGGRVRLLGGETALLDRERGPVARRVHAPEAGYAAVGVDGDEPGGIDRDARDLEALFGAEAG